MSHVRRDEKKRGQWISFYFYKIISEDVFLREWLHA